MNGVGVTCPEQIEYLHVSLQGSLKDASIQKQAKTLYSAANKTYRQFCSVLY